MNGLTDQENLAGIIKEIIHATMDLIEDLKALDQKTVKECPDRRRTIIALGIVIKFITRVRKRDALEAPLLRLQCALQDLDYRGIVAPMLQTEQRSNSDPLVRVLLKGSAAATMSLLMKTKVPRKEAARQVAIQLRRGGTTFGDRRGSESWRSVAAWRDQAVKATKSKSRNRPLVASAYERLLAKTIVPADKREYAQFRRDILEILFIATRYDDGRQLPTMTADNCDDA